MCDEKTQNVSYTSLNVWLSEAVRNTKSHNFYEIFQESLEATIPKTAQILYNQGKRYYAKAIPSKHSVKVSQKIKENYLDKAHEMFEIYNTLVEANLPVGKKPEEDRHLFYLMKMDEDHPDISVSEWKKKWLKWKTKYGTLAPNEQVQSGSASSSMSRSTTPSQSLSSMSSDSSHSFI